MAASNSMASPARPTLHDRLMMLSSSPDLPDLKDLIAKKPKIHALRSGSAAAPLPDSTAITFTTAADVLRAAQAIDRDEHDTIDEPERHPATKPPVKRALRSTTASKRVAKEVVVLSSDGVAPIGDEETPTDIVTIGVMSLETETLQERPWKRFKSATESVITERDTSVQQIDDAKAVKPPARARVPRKKTSKSETVSKHFQQKPVAKGITVKASTPEPLNLEPAVQRRTDWTPPRADTTPEEIDPYDVSVVASQVDEEARAAGTMEIFKTLHDAYGHKATDADIGTTKQQAAKVLGKRRAIDMVSVNQSAKVTADYRTPLPVKEKAPKKKPRTITELATAAYIPKAAELDEDLRNEDSILEYFTVDNEAQDASKTTAAKGKGKAKAAKVSKSTKKKVPEKTAVLLSPESAMRRSARQDFVFGTSSQLAREQSPTFLKDLQTALRASNAAKEEGLVANNPGETDGEGSRKPNQGLWSVSARDEGGELVDVEVIDLVDSSGFPDDDSIAILNPWKELPLEPVKDEAANSSLTEIDSKLAPTNMGEPSQSPAPKSNLFLSQHKVTVNTTPTTSPDSSRLSYPLITALMEEEAPPPSNQQQSQEEVRTISNTKTKPTPKPKPRPKYEEFTDAKLAKEISSYGFKAVKIRSAMIALLDQCWRSKNQVATAGPSFSTSSLAASPKKSPKPSPKGKKTATTTKSVSSTSPAPKKPRGRPKKATSADNSNATAAAENEGATSPAKKRGRPRKDAAITGKTTKPSMAPPPKPLPAVSTPKRKKAATKSKPAVSESDVDSAAGLTSPEQLFSSPLAVDVSVSEDTEASLTLSPTMQQSALFSHITKAITSAPRTTDPENPSWYEKMLMYDPVILEDLTAWLNSGQLTSVGYDGEVAPADVKKWCESKSVCCLWRATYKGRERKRL
ncbi:hypothetical protein VPNG_03841 [Cytospora leucostoma]|uniref:Structure-specific endonuclease subunit SLX4 n=1 Tax=Cytospora leucostoma TaxID=1230097 RepID=A0A423XFD0_9PEZI|nr:hypothetical protein VPNG_03841 [Cytospora leucostoma]